MADAGDLKSSGDFTPCGFDSHPGHQIFIHAAHQNPFANGNAKVARRVAAIEVTRRWQPHCLAQAPAWS